MARISCSRTGRPSALTIPAMPHTMGLRCSDYSDPSTVGEAESRGNTARTPARSHHDEPHQTAANVNAYTKEMATTATSAGAVIDRLTQKAGTAATLAWIATPASRPHGNTSPIPTRRSREIRTTPTAL